MVMSETDTCGLNGTQCAHQKLLQKLYHELDAEREASTIAVNEALSTISRLQSEKGALKMEADHYKRFSEESLAMADDVIYHKEMEISALDCQLQAYRYKFLSMGYNDPGLDETNLHDSMLQRTENLACETSRGSLSSAHVAHEYKNEIIERDIYDVFEVPQSDQSSNSSESSPEKDENGLESSKVLRSSCCEKDLHELSDVGFADCCLALVETKTSISMSESRLGLNRFNGKSQIVEVGEEVRLLNEIKDGISLLHDEIMSWRIVQKSSPRDDSSLCALREAMLYFWL